MCLPVAAFALVLAQPPEPLSARVELPGALASWRKDIEAKGQRSVLVARIFLDQARNEFHLPADAPERPVLAALLRSAEVRTQLANAHALNINLDGQRRRVSVILLNMGRHAEWSPVEPSVLSHELGHAWLHATGFASPRYDGCLALHAGDIVQHALLRPEAARRGVPLTPLLLRNADMALKTLESEAAMQNEGSRPVDDPCRRAAALSLLLDLRLGLTDSQFPQRTEFEARLEQRFPGILAKAKALEFLLQSPDLLTVDGYRRALTQAASQVSVPVPANAK
jgi:hypothetical protein